MTIDKDTTVRLGSAGAIIVALISAAAWISDTVHGAELKHSDDMSAMVVKIVRNEEHLAAAVDRLDEIATSLKSGTDSLQAIVMDHELRIIKIEGGQ